MWLRLSNGNLLNLDLVTDVLFNDMIGEATLMGYGVNMHVSKDAYRYFKGLSEDLIATVPPKPKE